MCEMFWKDWKGGTEEHHFENLMQLKVGSSTKLEMREWNVATIICKNCETQLLIMLVLSSPFPPKSMLKIVVSLGYPETKFSLPSTRLS